LDTEALQPIDQSPRPGETAQQHLRFEQALLERLERHAPEVYDHVRRTACLAALVSDHLGLAEDLKEVVVCTAELHDIGKLAIARGLLGKPTPLDPTEERALRAHTVLGYRLLKSQSELEGVALMVRAIQEWHDGSGYPDGLSGEGIPLPARIVSVCDAFDTLAEPRPHRPSLTAGEAIRDLRRWAGIRFDPLIVDALSETLKKWALAPHRLADSRRAPL
jgi:HD-GYP domain-containing protein (c-di-GMP phosphodiesterase class II)